MSGVWLHLDGLVHKSVASRISNLHLAGTRISNGRTERVHALCDHRYILNDDGGASDTYIEEQQLKKCKACLRAAPRALLSVLCAPGVGAGGEFTMCGRAYNQTDVQTCGDGGNPVFAKHNEPITCKECLRVIRACRAIAPWRVGEG